MVKTAFRDRFRGPIPVALYRGRDNFGEGIIPTRAMRKAEVVKDIASEAMKLRRRRGFRVQAAGIGIPGLIGWEKGICLCSLIFPISGRNPHPGMVRRTVFTVAVINDVRAITLAERFGAGKESRAC